MGKEIKCKTRMLYDSEYQYSIKPVMSDCKEVSTSMMLRGKWSTLVE